jgi:nucleoid-associated protein YgaU
MKNLLNRFIKQKGKESRLDEDTALAIASDAAANYPNCEELSVVSLKERSGNLMWIVSSATVGRTLQVSIDDVSGKVVEIKESGVR